MPSGRRGRKQATFRFIKRLFRRKPPIFLGYLPQAPGNPNPPLAVFAGRECHTRKDWNKATKLAASRRGRRMRFGTVKYPKNDPPPQN